MKEKQMSKMNEANELYKEVTKMKDEIKLCKISKEERELIANLMNLDKEKKEQVIE